MSGDTGAFSLPLFQDHLFKNKAIKPLHCSSNRTPQTTRLTNLLSILIWKQTVHWRHTQHPRHKIPVL